MDPAVDLFTHFPSLVSCLRSSGGHFDISYLLFSRLVVVPPATRQRKVKVEKRRREFTMLLQYKSWHVTTFTNPCNKFEKSFANLTKHTSTRQWSKKGEGREKVERFYSSGCNASPIKSLSDGPGVYLRGDREIGQKCTGCPKKLTFRMLLEPRCTRSITSSQHLVQPDFDEPVSGICFSGRFFLGLSRIKRSQVKSIAKFGPVALNFG